MSYNVKSNWNEVYSEVIGECASLFEKKLADYGATWLYFRDISMLDTLWIKIKRIRTLEENGDDTLVGEGREGEFIGIINYAIVMLMKLSYNEIFHDADYFVSNTEKDDIPCERIMECYRAVADEICALMQKKNHDYGAAWVEMNYKSITDQIIVRVRRMKKFLSSTEAPKVSEGSSSQLMDIVNYAIFGLIHARGIES